MTRLYCSQNHENAADSRFCRVCGEKLLLAPPSAAETAATVAMPVAAIALNARYRLIRELGQGGFGRTYLAEDLNRFNELCVLKEFAPQVQGSSALQKAIELFEREAGILYKLQHPQIPRFRELMRMEVQHQQRLFLVQDFVQGDTFRDLLTLRKRQQQRFTESEVQQLLLQLLPVLEYIHNLGVVHRDISPDNLMLRQSDQLPILIDFGGVKQLAATVVSQLGNLPQPVSEPETPATRLGKLGYAPEEQMRLGLVYPHSDLYALAVTALVLLTGKEPGDLMNIHTLQWEWHREVSLSPLLGAVLTRMLAHQPSDRYPTARHVLQALTGGRPPTIAAATQPPATVAASDPAPAGFSASPTSVVSAAVVPPTVKGGRWGWPIAVLMVMVLTGAGSWWGVERWLRNRPASKPFPIATVSPQPSPLGSPTSPILSLSLEEQQRKQEIDALREKLEIDQRFFVQLVDQRFYAQHPELQGRQLSTNPEDADRRKVWDDLANRFLGAVQSISAPSRRRIGRYGPPDAERWRISVNQRNLSTRALYTLADVQFYALFPEQKQRVSDDLWGQIWYAIVEDQVQAIESGLRLFKLQFPPGSFSTEVKGLLEPGGGIIYIGRFEVGQFIRISRQGGDGNAKLWVYPPTSQLPPLLERSQEVSWSTQAQQSGYYEFVITSEGNQPLPYQLEIAADNVSRPQQQP